MRETDGERKPFLPDKRLPTVHCSGNAVRDKFEKLESAISKFQIARRDHSILDRTASTCM